MVGQRVQHHHRVLAGLDDLVQIAQRALAHRTREWPVLPGRAVVPDEKAPDQVAGRQVVMAGDRHQRALQPPGHVFDEACLAASRGALQHHRQAEAVALLKDGNFVAGRQVVRFSFRCNPAVHADTDLTPGAKPGRRADFESSSTSKRGA